MVKEILVNDVMHYMRVISIGRPQEALLCVKRSANVAAANVLSVRQQQQLFSARKRSGSDKSAQSERKSTPHFAKDNTLFNDTLITLTQIFQLQGSQHMKLVLFKLHMY